MSTPTTLHQPDEVLLGFARALRAAGVPVTLDRSRTWLEAAALVDLGDRQATYWAGRATLCGCPDDLTRYDQVFDAWFLAKEGLPRSQPPAERTDLVQAPLPDDDRDGTGSDDDPDTVALAMARTRSSSGEGSPPVLPPSARSATVTVRCGCLGAAPALPRRPPNHAAYTWS